MSPIDPLPPELQHLGDNETYLRQLTRLIQRSGGIIPFVGAGTSVPYKFPMWKGFLLKLAQKEGIQAEIEGKLDAAQFEEAAGALMDKMGARFQDYFVDHFGDHVLEGASFEGAVAVLPELSPGPVITTNFDHVLERAFAEVKCVLNAVWGQKITEKYVSGFHERGRLLYKLHGDVGDELDRILSLREYRHHYGTTTSDKVDRDKPLPKLLLLIFKTQPVLFVGCSLDKDRTVSVLMGAGRDLPGVTHYAILEQPKESAKFETKRQSLREQGFKVIWFPTGRFDLIETILRHLASAVPEGMRRCSPAGPTGTAWQLPAEKTVFVGREKEVSDLARELRAKRLISLLGPGGSGKTRLAIQAARAAEDHFKDGVAFVGLAALRDPAAVPGTIAEKLGLREQASAPPTDVLAEFLATKEMLLVLDNCEHLLEACKKIIRDLLGRTRQLTILATSRRVLDLAEERKWQVGSLGLPQDGDKTDPGRLMQYDAIKLFLRCAEDQRSGFALTGQNAPQVLQICRDLGGIPLAIELAAARLRGATVGEVVAGLSDALNILTHGPSDAPERHQTLEATIQWSYELLTPAQKTLLNGLSVFAGGATVDAVREVCYADEVEKYEARDRVIELVDWSLVGPEPHPGGMRFTQLETVRQYAFAKLLESPAANLSRGRHLEWILRLCEHGNEHMNGPYEQAWLDTFEVEHDNIRAGLAWAVESQKFAHGLRLGTAVRRFWEKRGHVNEGRRLLAELLNATEPADPQPDYARILSGAGILAYRQGDSTAALDLFTRALAMERELDDPVRLAEAINDLGIARQVRGDFEGALALHKESRELNLEANHTRQATVALYNLGNAAYETGDLDQAHKWLTDSARDFAAAGDSAEAAFALTALGRVEMHRGRYDASRAALEDALERRTAINNKRGMGDTLNGLGRLETAQGNLEAARARILESVQLQREVGDKKGLAMGAEAAALVATAFGKLERAATYLGTADRLRRAIAIPRRPVDTAELQDAETKGKAALGEERFSIAHAAGAAMSAEDIVAFASKR